MNLVIVVNDLSPQSEFSVEKMLLWLGPLKVDRFGIIPIFGAKTVNELAYIVNTYGVENFILASSYLVEELSEHRIEAVQYQIRSEQWAGLELNALLLPDVEDVEWRKLEPALDLFKELL